MCVCVVVVVCIKYGRTHLKQEVNKIAFGEGKSYLLQHPGLENSKDCIIHGFAKHQTRLSTFQLHLNTIREGDCIASVEVQLADGSVPLDKMGH